MREQVDAFLNHLAVERGFSGNTIMAYRNDLYSLADYLGGEPSVIGWSDVSADTLSGFVMQLQDRGYSNTTRARKTAAMKSFFTFLVSEGGVTRSPAQEIVSPKVGRSLPKTLTEEEVERLLEAPRQLRTPDALRDAAMLELLYATGMRVSELTGLDLADVSLTAGHVRCRGKGARERLIPLHEGAVAVIDHYARAGRPALLQPNSHEQALFLNRRGERLTRQGFWLILKQYAELVVTGIPVTPHTLRHSFATHLLQGGASLRQVQEFLGHASIASTQVYTHLSNEHIQLEYERAHPRGR